MTEWLRVGEAAALLYVHPNTLRRWADRGLITTVRVGMRRDRRLLAADVNQLKGAEK